MSASPWRILIIEDKVEMSDDAEREITEAFEADEDINVEVQVENDFTEGYAKVARGECDVVVLDVRRDASGGVPEDQTAGRDVFFDIKKARFVPVVFWTALPDKVNAESMSPLVSVVSKDDLEELPDAIRKAIRSGAVSAVAAIQEQVSKVLRDHMWSELGPNWSEYSESGDHSTVAHVLISRLAKVLDGTRDGSFTSSPSHRYVYPPVAEVRSPGDVLRDQEQVWWVVLTPACDFAQNKVDHVLLARASALDAHPKYQKWVGKAPGSGKEGDAWDSLRAAVLMATSGRYHYLPSFREIPDLVIDLEDARVVPTDKLSELDAVASLVSPFAEALLVQHSHFRGRIGVPDLNAALIRERLLSVRSSEGEAATDSLPLS